MQSFKEEEHTTDRERGAFADIIEQPEPITHNTPDVIAAPTTNEDSTKNDWFSVVWLCNGKQAQEFDDFETACIFAQSLYTQGQSNVNIIGCRFLAATQ